MNIQGRMLQSPLPRPGLIQPSCLRVHKPEMLLLQRKQVLNGRKTQTPKRKLKIWLKPRKIKHLGKSCLNLLLWAIWRAPKYLQGVSQSRMLKAASKYPKWVRKGPRHTEFKSKMLRTFQNSIETILSSEVRVSTLLPTSRGRETLIRPWIDLET